MAVRPRLRHVSIHHEPASSRVVWVHRGGVWWLGVRHRGEHEWKVDGRGVSVPIGCFSFNEKREKTLVDMGNPARDGDGSQKNRSRGGQG